MRAIDTNVLVRIIVQDDELQSRKALKYVHKYEEVFISHIVLLELTWVFESCYNLNKHEIIQAVESILHTEQFIVEDSDAIWSVLREHKMHNIEFSDCMIGVIAKRKDMSPVGTFDKKASRLELFELI